MMKINFNNIIEKAYETLILQDKLTFPLDVFNIKIKKNVKILTFTDLAKLNQCTFIYLFVTQYVHIVLFLKNFIIKKK